MASTLPAERSTSPEDRPRIGRAMTRCECSGLSFVEIRRRLREDGGRLEDLTERTGCGGTCTACLPDLREFLSRG
jgi:bacterioferritin-associated ferredoxin